MQAKAPDSDKFLSPSSLLPMAFLSLFLSSLFLSYLSLTFAKLKPTKIANHFSETLSQRLTLASREDEIQHLIRTVQPLSSSSSPNFSPSHSLSLPFSHHLSLTQSLSRMGIDSLYKNLLKCWDEKVVVILENKECHAIWVEYLKRAPITGVTKIQEPREDPEGKNPLVLPFIFLTHFYRQGFTRVSFSLSTFSLSHSLSLFIPTLTHIPPSIQET